MKPVGIIVLVADRPRAGKDTVADMLIEHGAAQCKVAFADELYREVADAYQLREDTLRLDYVKTHPSAALALCECENKEFVDLMVGRGESEYLTRTSRQILQWWGTEYRRSQNPNYWIDRLVEKVRGTPVGLPVAITDVRFPDEYEVTRSIAEERGGSVLTVRVHRPSVPEADDHVSNHWSLRSMEDIRIPNYAGLASLRTETLRMSRLIQERNYTT